MVQLNVLLYDLWCRPRHKDGWGRPPEPTRIKADEKLAQPWCRRASPACAAFDLGHSDLFVLRSLLATPCLKADPWRDLSVLSSPQVTSTDHVGQTLDVALTSLEVIRDGWFICARRVPPKISFHPSIW